VSGFGFVYLFIIFIILNFIICNLKHPYKIRGIQINSACGICIRIRDKSIFFPLDVKVEKNWGKK
jgi:hypothetical protein